MFVCTRTGRTSARPYCFLCARFAHPSPFDSERNSRLCTPQDTKNKIITPVHLDMLLRSSHKGIGRRPGSTNETRQQLYLQRKRKGDRLEKYFNKAHSYFPTLIHRSPNGYCTVIISNYFPAAHRLMSVVEHLLPFRRSLFLGQMCVRLSSSLCSHVAMWVSRML